MKILFAAAPDAWGGFLSRLEAMNPEHDFVATGAFRIDSLAGVDVLIPTMTPVTGNDLESADRLRLIQQVGAGLEGVDVDAAYASGIAVANVPTAQSGNADSVAEMGIYLMLALARDARGMARSFAEGRIGAPFGVALKGKRAGVVGLGGLGAALAVRLRALGMRVAGVRRSDPETAKRALGLEWAGTMNELPELLARSDFVILCLPAAPGTHGLFDDAAFDSMKPGAFLVNLGRGALVCHDALLRALESGAIAGAGLDVFWQEPPDPTDPVFAYNVIATPHVAGSTDISVAGILAAVSDNLARLVRGERLANTVTPP